MNYPLRRVIHARSAIVLLAVVSEPVGLWGAPPADLEAFVDSIATNAVESDSTAGVSITVALGADLVLSKGYGLADLEWEVPATAQTIYRIGSISKQFTAAAILLLVEDGSVGIDDPLTDYLPDYPMQGHTVTIRHLLQHTSGIQSFTDLPSYRRQMRIDVSHQDILDRFKDKPFHFAPGEKYRYCNSGFYLLGMVVEKASGSSFETFLRRRIFSPLELKHTSYDHHGRVIRNRARGYSRWLGVFVNARYLSMTQPFAAGALVSSAEDLVKWQRALVDAQLLTKDSYRMMTKAGVLADESTINYGLGTVVGTRNGQTAFSHGGGINGFRSDLVYFPEADYTIVVLANCDTARPDQISRKIAGHLFGEPKQAP